MGWGEALRLTRLLAADPSSHVAAAVGGWQFPASREYLAAKTAVDNYVAVKTAKRGAKLSQLPSPWDKPPERIGTASMSIEELRKVLDRHRALVDAEEAGVTHG